MVGVGAVAAGSAMPALVILPDGFAPGQGLPDRDGTGDDQGDDQGDDEGQFDAPGDGTDDENS